MKRTIKSILAILSLTMLFGCTQMSSKEKLKFTVDETGQTVSIAINEKSGYAVEKIDGIPCITKDGETVFKCKFMDFDQYNTYRKEIIKDKEKETYTYYKEGTKGKNNYIYAETKTSAGKQYIYLVQILGTTDANTGVILISDTNKETAQNTFDKVKLTIDIYAN